MNKHTKISLIVLVTVVLMLAIAIPALARTDATTCGLNWRIDNKQSDVSIEIPSDLVVSLEGSTLTRTCTGNIPLGESLNDKKEWPTYFTLIQMRDYLCNRFGGDACEINVDDFVIGPDEMGGRQNWTTYKGTEYYSEYWTLQVSKNGDSVLESVFKIE